MKLTIFLKYYLRSRFANTIGEARNYDRDYHRIMFTPDINNIMQLLHNPKEVKWFL